MAFTLMDETDIHQLNLIMEVLGTPAQEFMSKISSESVSSFHSMFQRCYGVTISVHILLSLINIAWPLTRLIRCCNVVSINGLCKFGACNLNMRVLRY